MHEGIITIERHIVEMERRYPEATGEFTGLLYDISLAAKIISSEVNKAGLVEIIGKSGVKNLHGEEVQKLDVFANNVLIHSLSYTGNIAALASEENEDIIPIPNGYKKGKYIVVFDPLDGSSNIDVNVSIGTIFSIFKMNSPGEATLEDFLQPGLELYGAGYVIYGSSTMFVYSTGNGVHGFTLDPTFGEFLLSHDSIKIPAKGKFYSVNEGYYHRWDKKVKNYIDHLKKEDKKEGTPYSLRYIGSLVSDFHRNLLYGGIFLYPPDTVHPEGKLRLLYEAVPMAYLIEEAGGAASTGSKRILEIIPEHLHQRTPLVIGSIEDVRNAERFFRG